MSAFPVIIAAVLVFVIVAALIGGLVGGLVSKHNKDEVKSGCGKTSDWQFDDTDHSNVTMGDRTFFVHRPPNYDQNTQYPVVLSFHGYGMRAFTIMSPFIFLIDEPTRQGTTIPSKSTLLDSQSRISRSTT